MAFGLGFSREKVLAAAEKFVQQGKLQSAISEYEKIIKEDPKDLTVLNTVGDLCQRIGQNDQAANYFRKAGDQYANDGFTVKAIAIYKKLTRLNPGDIEYVNKLADLYTQQGLMSDARTQYMQVADHCLKSGDNNQAARILQRILDLDPENTATKSKLADLYLKLGKKEEAGKIYFTAAESLYARGSYDAAEEALDRMIKVDPENSSALLLRGMIAADSGDSSSAVRYLEKVADLDSRPDALHALLRAKLQSDNEQGVEALVSKLLTLHNDFSGIHDVAGWYAANNHFSRALRLYELHADRLMDADLQAFQQALRPLVERIKGDPQALGIMARLLEKAQDSSQLAELMELQAHASAQKGKFQEARELYQKLAEIEPDNAQHQQNYKQMQVKLGEDPASRSLSPEEASQAFMVEALEDAAPAVHQNYDPAVEKAIEAALTDAELFVSYNVPAKAIPPLEAVLPMAPRDVTVNQRLATLYARGGRFADAARTCETLSEIYRERGHEKEAAQYLEAAQSYAARTPKAAGAAASRVPAKNQATVEIDLPSEQGAPSVQEFSFDVPDHLAEGDPGSAAEPTLEAQPPVHEIKLDGIIEARVAPEAASPAPQRVQEIDVSSEWEDMLTVEAASGESIETASPDQATEPSSAPRSTKSVTGRAEPATEKIKEIEFYIDQGMWDLAKKAILDLTEIAPDAPEITKLISAVSAGQSRAAATSTPTHRESTPALAPAEMEFPVQAQEKPSAPRVPSAASAIPSKTGPAAHAEAPEFVIAPAQLPTEPALGDSPLSEVPEKPRKETPKPSRPLKAPGPMAPPRAFGKAPKPSSEESPLEEILESPPSVSSAAPRGKKDQLNKSAAHAKKAVPEKNEKTTEDILSDFIGDLEKSDLVDFAPRPKPEPRRQAPVPAPKPEARPAAAAPVAEGRLSSNGDMRGTEATSMLSDILSELQEETAAQSGEDSDPETHYNLGIAFKEMGLLDEAIGELQKVCHAMDRGNGFSQPIQAYTWLAQCLVDKGVPEAAVRWYQKALQLSDLDDSSRCAIYYDLAAAYEASGDDKSALANFMEVYGSNIDFRDVASRIKALKS